LIITDSEGKQPVVILSLDEYEALLDGRVQNGRDGLATRLKSGDVNTGDGSQARPYAGSEEEHVDMAEIEAAVEAVNREAIPEPKVVPITRKNPASEQGEEQFYMEPL
jgi:hypothetical protein